jgi:DNA-directed RNA polymerase III subunit RPC1
VESCHGKGFLMSPGKMDIQSHGQAVGDRHTRALLPYEIMELTDSILGEKRFTNECNAAYLTTVRDFVLKHVAEKVAKERRDRGMFDALERYMEFDEDTDLSMGASGTHT